MNVSTEPEYAVWAGIDYRPAISSLFPSKLLTYLRPGGRVLDIGCGQGQVSIPLAAAGAHVTGIDLNGTAIRDATIRARSEQLESQPDFRVGDFLESTLDLGLFDAVLLIRMLTCLPSRRDWLLAMDRASSYVSAGGLIYVHDFLLAEDNPVYGERYQAGARLGWRAGNFSVNRPDGTTLFIAHHHSRDEVAEIVQPYEVILLEEHDSLSMNGNACRMFEFIGRSGVPTA